MLRASATDQPCASQSTEDDADDYPYGERRDIHQVHS